MSNISMTKRKAIIEASHRVIEYVCKDGGRKFSNEEYHAKIGSTIEVFVQCVLADRRKRQRKGLDWIDLESIRDTEKRIKEMQSYRSVNITV